MNLNYNKYNTVIGLRAKGTIDFVKVIMPGETYQWPEELDFNTAEFVTIGIPPQYEDEEVEPEIMEVHLRDCSKCKGGHLYREEVCCSERVSGLKWKWTCDSCSRVVYSRGD